VLNWPSLGRGEAVPEHCVVGLDVADIVGVVEERGGPCLRLPYTLPGIDIIR